LGNVAGEMVLQIMKSTGVLDRMPPDAVAQIEQSMAEQGFSIIGVVFNFILCPIFGLLGGLIGYAVFRQKKSE
jgi:hypothetical protein